MTFRLEYGKANLTSLVERRSRFTVVARNPRRLSAGVMSGIQHHLHMLPLALRQSITFDRGTEFSAFATLQKKLAMTSYFCEAAPNRSTPFCARQKGGENGNCQLSAKSAPGGRCQARGNAKR